MSIQRLAGRIEMMEAPLPITAPATIHTDRADVARFHEFGPAATTDALRHLFVDDVVVDGTFQTVSADNLIVEQFNYGIAPDDLRSRHLPNDGAVQDDYPGLTVIAANWACNNYFHWLHQGVASAFSLTRRLHAQPSRLAVPPLPPVAEAALAAAGLGDAERITLRPGTRHRFRSVAWCNVLAGRCVHYPGFSGFTEFVKRSVPLRPPKGRRIYVSRRDAGHRRVLNEDALVRLFEARGFEIVEGSRLSFAAQVALFHDAAFVAGPHGAGFANIAFCNPGATVYEMMTAQYRSACMRAAAQNRGLHYFVDFTDAPGATQSDDWSADLEAVRRRLDAIDA